MAAPLESGYAFPGVENLHQDIYPAIDALSNPSLHQPGKVVLITGAGRGIGRAIALQYAYASVASINLVARTATQLDEVEREINNIDENIRVRKFSVDVTNEESVSACADAVNREEGRLDVLINNAGASAKWVPITESDPSPWWDTLEVNLKGPYLFVRAFLPLLVATAEKTKTVVDVVNVSSIGAHVMMPGASAYQISKLALNRLTEFVDLEYGSKRVNVVSVHPGGVYTALGDGIDVLKPFLIDTPELCGGFMVWLTKGQRTWLSGRYLSATWDVEKLESMKEEIVKENKLKARMVV